MRLLFFQNCVSPHQIPYIKELVLTPKVEELFLIVPRYDYNERKNMGWDNRLLVSSTAIKIIYQPKKDIIKKLLNKHDTYCFFSGIRADKDVFEWLKESLNYPVKRYIITEPPFTFNKPLWMHYIRFFLQDYKFVKYIHGVFAIGEDAVKYYKNISRKWKVFPFQYVTEHNERTKGVAKGDLKLLFVGNLCKRKNVTIVIEALKGLNNLEFTIVGNGEEKTNLKKLAQECKITVSFLGAKDMKEIPSIMQENDVLILPSLHDGWGAVVNEAMDLGLYVIVSNRCGARTMLDKGITGEVFISNNIKSLRGSIVHCLEIKDDIRKRIKDNIQSFDKFRGKSVAKYFINCIEK
ncbi:glycosyltransferase family 4 protein [Phocaeicola plebeius]|jgi:glycosyltransferase involved in cell wall biosynthesis|uniref:glycosyltransferase family 4 protein n=1 Tax=Phocaeicola plebeius TaxID=310297 RepID=UPI003078EAB2